MHRASSLVRQLVFDDEGFAQARRSTMAAEAVRKGVERMLFSA
jgi:hypothetical protein